MSARPLPHATAHTLTRLRDASWVMLAADALGAAEAMLQQVVGLCRRAAAVRPRHRQLPGRQTPVREMAAELEPARSLVWYAAHAFDALPEEASLAAAHAKAHLGEIGRFIAR